MGNSLLTIGKLGVLNAQAALNTTSNNINNVNTEGYTRKQTVSYTSITGTVGYTSSRRIVNEYTLKELYSDQGNVGYYQALYDGMSTVDQMLSDDDMSVSTSIDSLFESLASSVQNPTATSNREEVIGELEILVTRLTTLNQNCEGQIDDANAQAKDDIQTANELIKSIYEANQQIRALSSDTETYTTSLSNDETYLELLDNRDQLISQLSSLIDISMVSQDDGTINIYMSNGQMLASGDAYATLSTELNEYDATRLDVYVTLNVYAGVSASSVSTKISYDKIGGSIGGYLESTDEIRQTMRELGQLAVAFADAMNVQNESGITLEGEAGSSLFEVDDVYGVANISGQSVTCTFNRGEGSNVTSSDFYAIFDSNSGSLLIYEVGSDGTVSSDNLIATVTANEGNFDSTGAGENDAVTCYYDEDGKYAVDLEEYGITLHFNSAEEPADGNVFQQLLNESSNTEQSAFMVQPTLYSAGTIELSISKAEDLAYASAVVVSTGNLDENSTYTNVGNAVITLNEVSITGEGFGILINSDTNMPEFSENAPTKIVYEASYTYQDDAGADVTVNDVFVIYNEAGDAIGYADGDYEGADLFANTTWTDDDVIAEVEAAEEKYGDKYVWPGYEVTISGTVYYNDTFNISINEDGTADNSNGVKMAALNTEDLVASSGSTKVSFTESYADLVATLGTAVSSASTLLSASESKLEQTENLYSSESGVSLDEEASNLLLYQQAYQACAKIIEAAETVFNALIEAV